jgi:hypothetical protein
MGLLGWISSKIKSLHAHWVICRCISLSRGHPRAAAGWICPTEEFLSAFVPNTPFPLLSLSARTYDTLMTHAVPALLISHSI